MADFRLSERAASDLSGIADYTIQNFGIEQARRYRDGLVRSFRQLSDNPYWVVVLKISHRVSGATSMDPT